MGEASTAGGPDLTQGVPAEQIAEGAMLAGHVGDEAVLIARKDGEYYAIGATCSHYSGPLAEGVIVGHMVRCPWHHAGFDLNTGAAVRAPGLHDVGCWRVEQRDGRVFVREKRAAAARAAAPASAAGEPAAIVIVGGGAAGHSAAMTLRREGFGGRITILSADDSPPYDRPNLSKGYLAGSAGADALPLQPDAFYGEQRIDLRTGTRVARIDSAARRVELESGASESYDALLLATGAEPVRLNIPGANLPHVHLLRTRADGEALAATAAKAKRAVVVGASFIGLEAAASLRTRNVEVHVVAPGAVPMDKVLGPEVGAGFQRMHEQHGVTFHMGTTPASIDAQAVTLANGERLPADLVVVGIGVRPALALAAQAGAVVERGVVVDEQLRTSVPGIWAAGDIALWPDRHSGERIRVEHWAVAERQGAAAARSMMGLPGSFDAVPFFWTEQYDLSLVYVGHAERWDAATLDGSFDAHDCTITYSLAGKRLAVATVYRDHESLRMEAEMEAAARAIG